MANDSSAKNIWSFPLNGPNLFQPSSYLYQMSIDYSVNHGIDFHHSLVEIAKIHKNNLHGPRYVYYGSPIGKGMIRLFFPSETSEFENEKYLRIQRDENKEESKKIISGFKRAIINHENRVLEYKPQYSYFGTKQSATPFQFIFYATLRLKPTFSTTIFQETINSVMNFYKDLNEEVNWVVYQEIDKTIFHAFIPFNSYEELDTNLELSQILSKKTDIDSENIRKIFYSQLEDYQTCILSYVSSCDNSGCAIEA